MAVWPQGLEVSNSSYFLKKIVTLRLHLDHEFSKGTEKGDEDIEFEESKLPLQILNPNRKLQYIFVDNHNCPHRSTC